MSAATGHDCLYIAGYHGGGRLHDKRAGASFRKRVALLRSFVVAAAKILKGQYVWFSYRSAIQQSIELRTRLMLLCMMVQQCEHSPWDPWSFFMFMGSLRPSSQCGDACF